MNCLGPPKEFLQANRGIFALRANRHIFAWQHTTCLVPLKELINPTWRTSSSLPSGYRDVFAWQHVNSHGPPKESTKLSARFISSLLIDLQSLTHTSSNTLFTSSQLVLRVVYWGASLPHFQYYSVYWLSTSTTCSLLKGYRSILPVLLHLLVLN
jgi:hypothetical protein